MGSWEKSRWNRTNPSAPLMYLDEWVGEPQRWGNDEKQGVLVPRDSSAEALAMSGRK